MSGPSPRLTAALRDEYARLFQGCVVAADRFQTLDRVVARMLRDRERYVAACDGTAIPWVFASIVHELESGGDFTRHLHNGDLLARRTRRVPKGRPAQGKPPFAWETSAADALAWSGATRVRAWPLAAMLYRLEAFNGFGYRMHHADVLSPYLWSGSNHYVRGKYVGDGRWSATAVSTQIGGGVVLRRLAELGEYSVADAAGPAMPRVVPFQATRPRDNALRTQARALQRWLNTHAGIFLREDGWPGPRTAAAYFAVTGHALPGAP